MGKTFTSLLEILVSPLSSLLPSPVISVIPQLDHGSSNIHFSNTRAEDASAEWCALLPENLSRSSPITYFKERLRVLGCQESCGQLNASHLAYIFLGLGTV